MEKRGKSKEIILLALGVLLVLVTAITLFGKRSPAPASSTATTATPVVETPAEQSKEATETKSTLPTPSSLLGASPGNTPNRNPFASPTAAPASATASPGQTAKMPPANGQQVQPLPPFNPVTGPAAASAEPAALELRGIIKGKNPLAIIRRGETRYFAHVGEKIEGQYIVASIESDRVVLKNKDGNKTILPLGGGV